MTLRPVHDGIHIPHLHCPDLLPAPFFCVKAQRANCWHITEEKSTMVLHVIAVEAFMLASKLVQEGYEEHKQEKTARRMQIASMTAAP